MVNLIHTAPSSGPFPFGHRQGREYGIPLTCGLQLVSCAEEKESGVEGGELNGNLHRDQFQQISWTASPPLKEWDGGCEGGPQPAHQRSVPACQLWLLALHCTPLVPVIGVLAIFQGINI